MSTHIVQSGDVLLIPAQGLTAVTVEWRQNLSNKKSSYHTGMVNVKDKVGKCQSSSSPSGTRMQVICPGFPQKRVTAMNSGSVVRRATARKMDRVYHDTSRNPFQHRFVKSALLSMATDQVRKVAEELKVPRAEDAISLSESLFGDPLRAF
ncbi:hypothetical protein RhiJN_09502 [Ceratobasidium sp. AG-Ba]|nr:hypothetical protein RhiJN_09502 [Ceratobasidium sp. AG-Ba]QRW10299.1 hypothetical protein RhiLY_09298 [Ceratobasidium sp. AG-Ba]